MTLFCSIFMQKKKKRKIGNTLTRVSSKKSPSYTSSFSEVLLKYMEKSSKTPVSESLLLECLFRSLQTVATEDFGTEVFLRFWQHFSKIYLEKTFGWMLLKFTKIKTSAIGYFWFLIFIPQLRYNSSLNILILLVWYLFTVDELHFDYFLPLQNNLNVRKISIYSHDNCSTN